MGVDRGALAGIFLKTDHRTFGANLHSLHRAIRRPVIDKDDFVINALERHPTPMQNWNVLFNEEENVPILQSELGTALKGVDHEIIFVDDGSADRTVERIESAPNVRVIRFQKNAGQSAAIYAGVKAAHGATVVLIDGDLQNDPADIPRLLDEIARGADLVCGYRAQRRDTRVKRLTSQIANFVRSRFTEGRRARHRLHTESDASRMRLGALVPFKGMHRFIPALVKGAGYRLVELPVNHRPRRFGQSKYGFGNRAVRATIDMFGVRWLLSRRLDYNIRGKNEWARLPEPSENALVKLCPAVKLALPHGEASACLANLLSADQIIPEMKATERWSAIVELIDLLVSLGKIKPADRDSILAALRQREETMSTGIGFGIAIPHCSSDRLDEVVAAFGRSTKGIEFDALDNAPVKFVVLFIVPKNQFQTHLRTLASIAKFLNDRSVRESLASAKSADEILTIFRERS